MNFRLKVWRQKDPKSKGKLVEYQATNVSPNTSFLEMLDVVNEGLIAKGEEPIAFDSDCREGICGTCSLTINGEAHGPDHPGAACEVYMRRFKDGATIVVEPFRAKPFPLLKDLVVDRSALDRIVQAGGFIAARAGSAPEANATLVPKQDASGVHWLRCLRGGVPERVGDVVHGRESFAPCFPAAGPAGTDGASFENGDRDGRRRFRQLHEHLRVRSRLPRFDQCELYRKAQS